MEFDYETSRKVLGAPRSLGLGLVVLLVSIAFLPGRADAITLPAGFEDQPVATVDVPTAVAFTPDGRMLIAGKNGLLSVYQNGVLGDPPALDLYAPGKLCNEYERGLLGVEVDPSFESNGYIYLFYTFKKFGVCDYNTPNSPVSRVSRFVLGDNNIVDPATETILIDNIPAPDGQHNGGDLHFGKDGYLYVSVGDGFCDYAQDSGCAELNDAARDLSGLAGKILRVTRDGVAPADNPYQGADTEPCNLTGRTTPGKRCQEIYSSGLRNPFRIAFDPNAPDTRFHINDVGSGGWEEIDLGRAGADYGWNVREGHCAVGWMPNCGPPPPPEMTNPIYDYGHDTGCSAITGAAFVPAAVWRPRTFDDAYLFGDYVCGKIFKLESNGGGDFSASEFATDLGTGAPISMTFGPYGSTQALYYITWANSYEVRRIVYTGPANRAPTARASADPADGDLPLSVSFDGTQSSDPDDDPLSYEWDFGDGSPHETGATLSHTYTTAGTYTATVEVRDDRGGESSATLRIDAGNNAPVPMILAPAPTKLFQVGEEMLLRGAATDLEDGQLPARLLTWEVIKHHNTHTHPFLPETAGNDIRITAPQPEDLDSTTTTYLEIRLTATDSRGLSRTVTQRLDPRLVALTLETEPAGLQLEVQGRPLTAPQTVVSWEGWDLLLNATDQLDPSGNRQAFISWSDGGSQSHTLTTPAAAATYTATFWPTYARPKAASPVYAPLAVAYERCASPDRIHPPPFSYASCAAPVPSSGNVTVGTPDANGAAAGSVAFARLRVMNGNPGTPADEADVALTASATDVRCKAGTTSCGPANAQGGPDYTGQLQLHLPTRITDPLNDGTTGTTEDFLFPVTIACAATASTAIGGTCALTTSLDAVAPGAIPEGKRSIWQLGQVVLNDGGPDGDVSTIPNDQFMRQALFVP